MSHAPLHFRPRLLQALKGYNAARFARDVGAGVTVGIVALPLAMAFAIASGLKPEVGIFTAVVGGLIVSLLGGSSVQIGGPAGAFIVVVADIVQRYGVSNLIIATFAAGILLFIMGALRLGTLIRLIPVSIVTGFTNGIALLIAFSQIRDFLGLQLDPVPSAFIPKLLALWHAGPSTNFTALGLGVAGLLLLIVWPKTGAGAHAHAISSPGADALQATTAHTRSRFRRGLSLVPAPVVLLIISGWAVHALQLPVDTIGSRFGGISQEWPPMHWPDIAWDSLKNLWGPIITIALLGAIESLLCARVADNLVHERHDPNQELMAQGLANMAVPVFGGMPVTGTIARTSLNARLGATSPIAGALHACTLLLIVWVAAPLARHVPLCALAAILLYMAWNMGEWSAFVQMRRLSLIYRTILLTTFALTVVIDLTVAVEAGLVLACLFFIYRISQLTRLEPIGLSTEDKAHGIEAWHVYGSLFFGAVGKLEALLDDPRTHTQCMVLECHQLISLDTTGVDALKSLATALHVGGGQLILCELNRQPADLIRRSAAVADLHTMSVFSTLAEALAHARKRRAVSAQSR